MTTPQRSAKLQHLLHWYWQEHACRCALAQLQNWCPAPLDGLAASEMPDQTDPESGVGARTVG
jgi:hypothetical protein